MTGPDEAAKERRYQEAREARYRLELDGETLLVHDLEDLSRTILEKEKDLNGGYYVYLLEFVDPHASPEPELVAFVHEARGGSYSDVVGWLYDRASEEMQGMAQS